MREEEEGRKGGRGVKGKGGSKKEIKKRER